MSTLYFLLQRVRFGLVTAFALLLLAGCGASTPAQPTPTPTTAAQAPQQLRVALISPNRIFDKGYIELAWNGVQRAETELGAEVKAVEVLDQSLIQKNVNDLVAQGYSVIVMVSPQLQESSREAALAHPEVMFIGVDHFQAEPLPNLVGLVFREDQAGYLAGALAGLMTETDRVGAVLGTDVIPQLRAFGEGFRQGALAYNASAEVTLVYHNQVPIEQSFIDPEWGRLQAEAMMEDNVDVIFAAAGSTGNGALLAIAERADSGVMGIGVDTDQYTTLVEAQPILLSSSTKQVDVGLLDILKAIDAGTVEGGNFYGSIGLAPFHDFEDRIPADVKETLSTLEAQLKAGEVEIVIPTPTP